MDINEKAQKAVDMVKLQIEELSNIVKHARQDKDFNVAREKLQRWKSRTARLLSEQVHPSEGEKLQKKKKGSFIINQPLRNLDDEANMYRGFLSSLMEEVEKHPKDILSTQPTVDISSKTILMRKNKKIGKDAVVIGNVNADVGDGSVVIGPTDQYGNVILNQPMAIGRNAKAGSGSIAIGTNAGAGFDINAAFNNLYSIIKESGDNDLRITFDNFVAEIKSDSNNTSEISRLWNIIKTSATLSGAITLCQQIGTSLRL